MTSPLRRAAVLALAVCTGGAACSSPRPPAQRLPMELLRNRARRTKEVKTTTSIVGVVLGPDGSPVDFALVAAVNVLDDPEDGKAPLLTTSTKRGKFEIAGVPPGVYGVTVTSPAANVALSSALARGPDAPLVGSFAGVVTAVAGEPGPPMLLRLGSKGVTLSGRVMDEKGQPLPEALVRAVRASPFEGDSFFARTNKEGQYTLAVPEGSYFLVGQAPERKPVRIDVDPSSVPTEIPIRLPPALVPPTKEEVTAWISASGAVLGSVDGAETADLARLKDIVGKARVVGLGEATYTGSEFAKLKQRMFRYLVEEMGFSVLAIEAGQADARALDDYVLHGKGKLADCLRGLGYFSLDTEEAASLFAWMKVYNEDRKHRTKLRVRGVDVMRTAAAATDLEDYLLKVDKAFAAEVETALLRLRTNEFGTAYRDRPADEQEDLLRDLDLIAKTLEKNRRVYAAKSRYAAYAKARDDAAALVWAARVYRDEGERGAALADMTRRAIAELPAGTKVAVWAHNAQVSRRRADGGMGAALAEAYGADYVALGLTFFQGWVRAWDFTTGPTLERGTKLFRLPPAEPGSLESVLETAGVSYFYADVRKAEGALLPWFESRVPMRAVGTVFVADRRTRVRTVVKDAFDALVFVHKLSTVKFTETGKRSGQKEWD